MNLVVPLLGGNLSRYKPPGVISAGILTGICAVLSVVVVLELLGFASLATFVPAVCLTFVLGLCVCTIGTAMYWRTRKTQPEELDLWYIGAFTLTVTAGAFLWPVLRGLVTLSPFVNEYLFGFPISLFLFCLYIGLGLGLAVVAFVLAGLVGTLSTAGVIYYHQTRTDN